MSDVLSVDDVAAAERRCVLAVTQGGKKLQFVLEKEKLEYGARSKEYSRTRRLIEKQKNCKRSENSELPKERKVKLFQAKRDNV